MSCKIKASGDKNFPLALNRVNKMMVFSVYCMVCRPIHKMPVHKASHWHTLVHGTGWIGWRYIQASSVWFFLYYAFAVLYRLSLSYGSGHIPTWLLPVSVSILSSWTVVAVKFLFYISEETAGTVKLLKWEMVRVTKWNAYISCSEIM